MPSNCPAVLDQVQPCRAAGKTDLQHQVQQLGQPLVIGGGGHQLDQAHGAHECRRLDGTAAKFAAGWG